MKLKYGNSFIVCGTILVDAQYPKSCSRSIIGRFRRSPARLKTMYGFAMKTTKIIVHIPYPTFRVRLYPIPKAAVAASAENVTSPRLYATLVEIPERRLNTATIRYPK